MSIDDYTVTLPITPRFGDSDLPGHVNNAVYLTFFESGRVEYWARFTGNKGFEDWPFILARTEIDFLAEAFPGQALTQGIRVSRIGTKSFDFDDGAGSNHDVVITQGLITQWDIT